MRAAPALSLLLATSLLAAAAGAAPAAAWESASRIRATAETWVAAQSKPGVTVQAGALDARLRLGACPRELSATSNDNTASSGSWTVQVSCAASAGGPALWRVYVPVRIQDLREVLVLTRALRPGEPITAADLVLQSRDVATLGYGYLERLDQAVGQTLRRPIAAGSTLTPDTLIGVKLIHRGNLVTILGQGAGLQVQSQGKALSDGALGESIQVENSRSRRVVQGLVRDSGTVEVAL